MEKIEKNEKKEMKELRNKIDVDNFNINLKKRKEFLINSFLNIQLYWEEYWKKNNK